MTSSQAASPLPALLTVAACLVASISYIGAITTGALITFLMPSTLLVGLIGVRMRRTTLQGLAVVPVLAFLVAQVVNLISGQFQGPVARGTLIAAACTGVAAVLVARAPALMLVPLAGVVAGALSLGAGGQVQLVALLAAGFALVALGSGERESRRVAVPARLGAPVLLVVVLFVGAGVFAVLFQDRFSGRPAQAPLRTTINTAVNAPNPLSLGTQSTPAQSDLPVVDANGNEVVPPAETTAQERARAEQEASSAQKKKDERSWLWFLLLAVPLLLLLLVVGRLVAAALSWRRHYRAILRAGRGPGVVWTWALAHLGRVDLAPPLHDSPDLLADGHLEGVPERLREPVGELAALVAPAVFGGVAAADDELDRAWALARRTNRDAWSTAGFGRRCSARWRMAPRPVVTK